MRISKIEIRNFPESRNEDVVNIVREIGKAIGVENNINEGDIQKVHRVDTRSKKNGQIRPIIAHMGSRNIRKKWLQHYKNTIKKSGPQSGKLSAKVIDQSLPDKPIYLNEHITVTKKLGTAERCK